MATTPASNSRQVEPGNLVTLFVHVVLCATIIAVFVPLMPIIPAIGLIPPGWML